MWSNFDFISAISLVFLASFLGAFLTHMTHVKLHQSTVRSSAFWCLVLGVIFRYSAPPLNDVMQSNLPLIFASGTYLGMTQPKHLHSYWYLVVGAIIIGIIYVTCNELFNGYGGKLGLIANFAIISSIGFFQLKTKLIQRFK